MAESIIRALSEATIHQIAAGEVIERPANVVKELVENALDAGATRITITYEEGGKSLIRVADNGKGMVADDLRHCWLPHTTSKIREMGDLEAVATMGFRGEALCSMAAVSELTLETRHISEEVGASLVIREGREEVLREAARSPGTTITVKHLFLNNPVRRKFLGTDRSEATRILHQVTRLALARPDVAFRLMEKDKEVLHLREGTLKHRAGDILGFHQVEDLLPIHWSDGQWRVEGLVSTPQQARQRSSYQHFYVNNRAVYSPVLQKALTQSYDVLPPGQYPVAVLFITLPPREIDVNIHPTKREIRFLYESRVLWALSQAVTQALRLATGAPNSISVIHRLPPLSPAFALADAPPALVPGASAAPLPFRYAPEPASEAPGLAVAEALSPSLLAEGHPVESQANIPYLQVHNRFILFAVSGGMMLVNQQAAHERVLYEKALEDMRRPGRFSSQQLLFPEVVELPPDEAQVAEEQGAYLQALGFELEAFGGRAFQLRGLPAEVPAERSRRILRDLLQDLLKGQGQAARAGEEMAQRLARAYARVTGIRLGESLDHARMTALMDALFATRNPYVSPSGSPVVVRFPLNELNSRFGLRDSA